MRWGGSLPSCTPRGSPENLRQKFPWRSVTGILKRRGSSVSSSRRPSKTSVNACFIQSMRSVLLPAMLIQIQKPANQLLEARIDNDELVFSLHKTLVQMPPLDLLGPKPQEQDFRHEHLH